MLHLVYESAKHNNGMHPTADTPLLIYYHRLGAAGDAGRWAATFYVGDKKICMAELKRLHTPELDRLGGYLDAARHIFTKGQYDVTLDAALFEIQGGDIKAEDVVRAAYPGGFNPIESRAECSLADMVSGVQKVLEIPREVWNPAYSIPEMIESNVREGYWRHVKACFDYTNARIVELGNHVPFVNVWGGFTYILYAPQVRRCLLLIGNTSD